MKTHLPTNPLPLDPYWQKQQKNYPGKAYVDYHMAVYEYEHPEDTEESKAMLRELLTNFVKLNKCDRARFHLICWWLDVRHHPLHFFTYHPVEMLKSVWNVMFA